MERSLIPAFQCTPILSWHREFANIALSPLVNLSLNSDALQLERTQEVPQTGGGVYTSGNDQYGTKPRVHVFRAGRTGM